MAEYIGNLRIYILNCGFNTQFNMRRFPIIAIFKRSEPDPTARRRRGGAIIIGCLATLLAL